MRNVLAVLLVLLSAFLLFWRLDGVPLWRDETTTANWGRVMAESFGVWVTGLEAERELVKVGMALAEKAGLAKKAPVVIFDPDSFETDFWQGADDRAPCKAGSSST